MLWLLLEDSTVKRDDRLLDEVATIVFVINVDDKLSWCLRRNARRLAALGGELLGLLDEVIKGLLLLRANVLGQGHHLGRLLLLALLGGTQLLVSKAGGVAALRHVLPRHHGLIQCRDLGFICLLLRAELAPAVLIVMSSMHAGIESWCTSNQPREQPLCDLPEVVPMSHVLVPGECSDRGVELEECLAKVVS